jgi:hypothetical protein
LTGRQRDASARLEENVEFVRLFQQVVHLRGKERSLAIGLASHAPVAPQRKEEPPAKKDLRVDVLRQVQLDEAIVDEQKQFLAKKCRSAGDDIVAAVAQDLGPPGGGHVLGLALEDRFRFGERCSALPELHDPGIPGSRQGSGPEVRADPERVLVTPGDARLGLREGEAVLHELFGPSVELADDCGVRAPGGKLDQAACVGRWQTSRLVPDPGFALGLGERVHVEHGLPLRVRSAVGSHGGAPPESALVGVVLPEVVNGVAEELRLRNLVFRVEDLERLLVDGLVFGPGLEQRRRLRVLLLDPDQGLVALDVLEPLEVVGIARRGAE